MTLPARTDLIRLREGAGMSRRALAREIGTTAPTVFRIEKGQRNPSLGLAERWLKALGPTASADLFFQRQAAA